MFAETEQQLVELPDCHRLVVQVRVHVADGVAELLVGEGVVDEIAVTDSGCHHLDQTFELGITSEGATAPIAGRNANRF